MLRALRRGAVRADGFALLVAVCNSPAARDRWVDRLEESLPARRLRRVHFAPTTLDPLAETLAQTGGAPDGPLALVDLELAVPSSVEQHPVLGALNLQRQEWVERVPHAVVLWVPEYLLALLGREAPDFLDRRSATLFFPEDPHRHDLPFRSAVWDHGGDTTFSAAQRRERVAELRARLHANADSDDPAVLLACAEWWNELGNHLETLGEREAAQDAYARALGLGERLHRDDVIGATRGNLGAALLAASRDDEAEAHLRAALAWSHASGRRDMAMTALANLGRIALHRGHLDEAADLFEAAGAARGSQPDTGALAALHNNLGLLFLERGQHEAAQHAFEQALRLARQTEMPGATAVSLMNLGVLSYERGDLAQAESAYRTALDVARAGGYADTEANLTGNLAILQRARSHQVEARRLFERTLVLQQRLNDPVGQARTHGNLANLLAEEGRRESAVAHLAEAVALFRRAGRAAEAARAEARIDQLRQDSP